jgi:hypothetical protein
VVKHFSEAEWADFTRNVVASKEKMDMQQHIQGGCQKCEETMLVWQSVVAIAEKETAFLPPANILRVVKSQFTAVAMKASRGFRMLFDSALQPITGGIRGSVSARQFLYETDDYYIDLRLEPRREADRACLIGQILTRQGMDRVAAGVSVRIQNGKVSIAETFANRFGEFQLEFDGAAGLHISIGGNQDSEIVLPLHGVHGKSLESNDLDG